MHEDRFSASVAIDIDTTEPYRNTFEGRFKDDVSVQFYGMLRSCISIANVSTQFARQLVSRVENVALHSYNGRPYFEAELEDHAFLNRTAPIGFFYGLPNEVPEFFFGHETTIGGFVCETTSIPETWVTVCNQFDLIIVPSRFCRSAFIYSGVTTPLMVVPHGLEPAYRPLKFKQRSKPFTFYETFNADAFPDRKSCEELIRCFKRAFAGRNDVKLRLRVEHNSKVLNYLREYDAFSLISLERPDYASTSQFAAIYSDVHCTVHPSKGEGFGLIPFQSIACETPVIAPKSSGMADYLDEDKAMLLRTSGATVAEDVYYKTGMYFGIDEDHLVDLLRYAEQNWEAEYEKVRSISPRFREQYSWPSVLSEFITLLERLTALENCKQRRELISASVSE